MSCFTVCCRQKISSPKKRTTDINEEIFSSVEDAKLYSYRELQIATQSFNVSNKIGEGGFGSVYKGRLKDGSLVAIKVLSAQSEQGVKEFLNEIISISGVEHENLVKLYGCCTEGGHRILVYGYLENNSLARTLLGGRVSRVQFTWKIRSQICIGVAQGLAFLHEEVRPHIIHRDIKASNVLLDKISRQRFQISVWRSFSRPTRLTSARVLLGHSKLWLFSPRICYSWKADTESRRVQLWRSPNGNRQRKKPQRQEITSRSTKSPRNVPRFRRGLYMRRACCPSWSIHRWRGTPTLMRLANISRSGFYAPK